MATNPILISAKELKNKNPKSLPKRQTSFQTLAFGVTHLYSLLIKF